MSDETTRERRLPPPAFPPTSGGRTDPGATRAGPGSGPGDHHDDAGAAAGDLALIEPDEPLPDRPELEEEGVASGIGDPGTSDVRDHPLRLDPGLEDLVAAVGGLAEGLRRRGRAALHVEPGMSRFEATLRAYCVGYLAGREGEGSGPEGSTA